MESKNKTILMTIIDSVLEEIIWVEKGGATVSLKEAIAKSIHEGASGSLESLERAELIGAYTAFQIRRQSFAENTKTMTDSQIAERIKLFIFEAAHEQMSALEAEVGASSESKLRKVA
ncbi:MAG: hypothetical protein LBL52_02180 [Rickettsiales bacterium]|jgi:hypothetical protein|nr:hypothetical protein [Rickettsiales bacterium]